MTNAIISESTFVGCDNLPHEMANRLDQPWHFVGTVESKRSRFRWYCRKCNQHGIGILPSAGSLPTDRFIVVDMDGRLFITDDLIEVMVYFGVCEGCDSVYWATSGPPFRRARAFQCSY